MKWWTYLFIITVSTQTLLSGGCSQAEILAIDAPEPLVAHNNGRIDFGNIDEGRSIEATFGLANVSKTSVIIDGVRSGCGCTIPTLTITTLAPGEEMSLPVQFNSQGKPGDQKNVVTVYYYPARKPDEIYLLNLTLSGYVRTRLSLSSKFVRFDTVHIGEVYEQDFTVSSDLHPTFEVHNVSVSDPQLSASPYRLNDNTFTVRVALRPSAALISNSATLGVHFRGHPTEKFSLPVSWKPYIPVNISPTSIVGQRTESVAKATVAISPRESASSLVEFSPVLNYEGGTVTEIESGAHDNTRVFELRLPESENSVLADTGFLELDWHQEDRYARTRIPIAITR